MLHAAAAAGGPHQVIFGTQIFFQAEPDKTPVFTDRTHNALNRVFLAVLTLRQGSHHYYSHAQYVQRPKISKFASKF